jgi:hypothetical protein
MPFLLGRLFVLAIFISIMGGLFAAAAVPVQQPMRMIKDVPQGATIEYLIQGRVVQTMSLRPGRYRITVEELK